MASGDALRSTASRIYPTIYRRLKKIPARKALISLSPKLRGLVQRLPRCSHLKELDTAVVLLKCQQEVRGSWRVTADAEVTFRGWFGQRSVSWLTGTSQLAINHPDLDCQAFRNHHICSGSRKVPDKNRNGTW